MTRCGFWIGLGVVAVALGAARARGDEIFFKNGDRLTGKIVSEADGKLVIDTKLAGKITVNMSEVKTFSTDEPIKIRMQDGTLLEWKVGEAKEGTVVVVPSGKASTRATTKATTRAARLAQKGAATRRATEPGVGPAAGGATVVGGGREGGTAAETAEVGGWLGQPLVLGKVLKINEEEPRFTGSVVANGQFERNAGKSEQFGLTATADRKSETDEFMVNGSYLYGRSQSPGEPETTNADNWVATAKYDDYFTKKFYGYADVRAEQDLVNFLDLRLTPGAGVGYQWVQRPDFNFKTEAGLAYVYQQLGDGGGTNADMSASVAYHVDKSFFNGHLSVYNDLQFLPTIRDPDNYLILSTLGVRTPINDQLFSEIKLIVNYDSKPGPGAERTDEQLLVGLGYKF